MTHCLGFSWSGAHALAQQLEHVSSVELIEKLDEFLPHPNYCPHGFAIPRNGEDIPAEIALRALTTLRVGEKSFIRKVEEENELMDYLQELGISIDMPIIVTNIAPYEGPISLQAQPGNLQVSYKAATHIFVE